MVGERPRDRVGADRARRRRREAHRGDRRHRHAARRRAARSRRAALLRPSIQQSDGRCGAEVEDLAREWDEADFLARAGNGDQPAAGDRQAALDRPPRAGRLRPHRDRVRLLRLHQLEADGRARDRAQLGAGSGLRRRAQRTRSTTSLIAAARLPREAIPPKAMSHAILGEVTPQAAARDRACGGHAGGRRRGGHDRLGARRRDQREGRRAAQVRRGGRHPDRDRPRPPRPAPLPRLSISSPA